MSDMIDTQSGTPGSEEEEPTRNQVIIVRVSIAEKKAIRAKAKEARLGSMSAYLREVGQGAKIQQSLPIELRQQLVGIGNNLNQIARVANSGKHFQTHEAQLQRALDTILALLV